MRSLVVLAFVAAASPVAVATGLGLKEALGAALQHDPVLRAAEAQSRADGAALPLARSALLPRIALQSSTSRNSTTQRIAGPNGGETTAAYVSQSNSLNLTQPLYRAGAWMNLRRGEATARLGLASYESALQQAIDRLVSVYMDGLRLERELAASKAELESRTRRRDLTKRLLDAGQASMVEFRNTEADYAQEVARRAELEVERDMARRELQRLTGLASPSPAIAPEGSLRQCAREVAAYLGGRIERLDPFDIEAHPVVVFNRLRVEQAEWETRRRSSEHMPAVDLVANVNRGRSASELTIGRELSTRYLGVLVNVPIYSGGGVSASVAEALALQQKSEIELENARATIRNDQDRALSQARTSLARLSAEQVSVEAASLALDLESRRFSARLASEVELAAAKARLEMMQSKAFTALIKAVADYTRLMVARGNLSAAVIDDLSASVRMCTEGAK